MQLRDKKEFSQDCSQIPISTGNKQPELEALKAVAEMGLTHLGPESLALSHCQTLQGKQLLPCSVLPSWGPMTQTCRNGPGLRQEEWWAAVHSIFNNVY